MKPQNNIKRKNKRRILWITNAFAAIIIVYILMTGLDTETGRLIIQWVALAAMSATGMYTGSTIYENIYKKQ